MKVTLNITPDLSDDEVEFHIRQLSPQLDKLIKQLQNIDFKLIGSLEDRKYTLDFQKIITIYASDKKVYVSTENKQEYRINETLTHPASKLPMHFLRISNSE